MLRVDVVKQLGEFSLQRAEVRLFDGRTREHLLGPVQGGLPPDLIALVEGR